MNASGTRVVFASRSSDLVPGDTNNTWDVFLWEQGVPALQRLSVAPSGVEGNRTSFFSKISADGRFVLFLTAATNLYPVSGGPGGLLLVRDLQTGALECVSVDSQGLPITSGNLVPRSISGDGRFVCFDSDASNLVANDQNRVNDVFVRDRLLGITTRVSEDTGSVEGDAASGFGQISRDGRFVSFYSDSTNWRWGIPGSGQIYRRDLATRTTEIVSADAFGVPGNLVSRYSAISSDGSTVVFVSPSSNLVPDDRNGWVEDVFVRDMSCPSISAAYELACPGSNGIPPLLYLAGCPARGRDVLLWLRGTLPYAPALLLFGRTRGNLSLGSGCALLVDQPFGVALPLATDAGGIGSLGFRIPPLPSLVGDLTLQAIVLDPGLPQLLSSTRGIDVRMR